MLAGGVVDDANATEFWRTWWLGDTAGGLVVLPLLLSWAQDPVAAWRRIRTWEGAAMIAAVAAVGFLAVSTEEPIMYIVYPTLIWAAIRFGPPGATVAVAITALIAIGVTAHDVGPFSTQAIDRQTLSTQLYIAVAALTTLFLGAVVGERERWSRDLARARRAEGARTAQERRRIARDLHDSVSQSLFSMALHTRTAQNALKQDGGSQSQPVAHALETITGLTKDVQSEMRVLIFDLQHEPVQDGLVAALARHAADVRTPDGPGIDIRGPGHSLALSEPVQTELFAIAREALANAVRHAGATAVQIRVTESDGEVVATVRDNGRGFDPAIRHPGHFGLESMRSRASEVGGRLTIASAPGRGTVVAVRVPAGEDGQSDGGRATP
jgi:signal transduction histidine kinase